MRWLATGEAGIPEGTGWLSPVERVRLTRLRYTKPRTEYLLRRWAAKRAVAEALALPADPANLGRIELLNHASGAPFVQVDGSLAGVDVSLTDRAGWAVVLVGEPGSAAGGTIGVDLELVEPRSSGFVADFLTGAEQAYVASRGACGQPGWDEAANLLWSAKEAVLKVRRTGLRADTRSVDVRVEHDASEDGWAAMEVVAAEGTAYPGGGDATGSSCSPSPTGSTGRRRPLCPAVRTSRTPCRPIRGWRSRWCRQKPSATDGDNRRPVDRYWGSAASFFSRSGMPW